MRRLIRELTSTHSFFKLRRGGRVVLCSGAAGIRAAGEAGDWRALEAFLRLSFPGDYRRDASINVTATANTQQAAVVCTEEQRQRLIELRQRLLAEGRGN